MRFNWMTLLVVFGAGSAVACADLVDVFADYDATWGIGVSGLQSSYDADTRAGLALSGDETGAALPTFGPDRVSYPRGVGQVPSPGGEVGMRFDQGVLGILVGADSLTVQLATRIDPLAGVYSNDWKTWYGQGDVFLDVLDSTGRSHYALLGGWARDAAGDPISINRGHFNDARDFHLSGGPGGSSLEGSLVRLTNDGDVSMSGGRGAYGSKHRVGGLDMRLYANDGEVMRDAGLEYGTVMHDGNQWHLETWSLGLDDLSSDREFELALHTAASCGNDQIGLSQAVPEPGSLSLVVFGALVVFGRRR